ncbi:MAG: YggS family pyridoxal phosphate-dependent enzyme [Sulfuriflexus sp.]|nr:YggS family pyridoxal phosphate-dependent enzyme [Sulfuriflexus sp.]
MTDISQNITEVQQRIVAAAEAVNRDPVEITLLAISKTRPIEDIVAAITAGQQHFGENYLQDALAKITELENDYPNLEWHFIGAIQSNKTSDIAKHFSWVHTVERLKIAQRLNDQRPENLSPIQVCIQVNISNEESKAGIPTEQVMALATEIAELPNLKLRGLMAIPAATKEPAEQRKAFAALRTLYEQLNQKGFALDTLSMGMSGDLEAAVAEGSTLVRIGTAIFGARA